MILREFGRGVKRKNGSLLRTYHEEEESKALYNVRLYKTYILPVAIRLFVCKYKMLVLLCNSSGYRAEKTV